jgi:hypothetical protein
MRDTSVAKHAHRVDANTADMSAAETTEVLAGETADMTGSKVATQSAKMNATETADMAPAETAAATRESSTTSRGQSNRHGCSDCENFSMHRSFHDLSLFLFVPCLIWPAERHFSETLTQGLPVTRGSQPKKPQCMGSMH